MAPMPLEPPVTRATLPDSEKSEAVSFWGMGGDSSRRRRDGGGGLEMPKRWPSSKAAGRIRAQKYQLSWRKRLGPRDR